jgi:DNA-directed RNA polymerase specialized sigma24 family protein
MKRECWRRYRDQHLDRSAGQEAERGGEGPGAALDAIPSRASGPAQLLAQVDEARAKLAALKPAERRALGLIAAGYSYKEIGALSGWTYTKTNRCASEGRATLRAIGEPA